MPIGCKNCGLKSAWSDWRQLDRAARPPPKPRSPRSAAKPQTAATRAETVDIRALELETEIAGIDAADSRRRSPDHRQPRPGWRPSNRRSTTSGRIARDLEEQVGRTPPALASLNLRAGDVEDQMQTGRRSGRRRPTPPSATPAGDWPITSGPLPSSPPNSIASAQRKRAASGGLFERHPPSRRTDQRNRLARTQLARTAKAREKCQSRQGELERQHRTVAAEIADGERRHREQSEQQAARTAAARGRTEPNWSRAAAGKPNGRRNCAKAVERRTAAGRTRARAYRIGKPPRRRQRRRQTSARAGQSRFGGALRPGFAACWPTCSQVDVQFARMIELALGDKRQHLVVEPDDPLLDHSWLADKRGLSRPSRFLVARRPGSARAANERTRPKRWRPGRADRFVQTAAEYQPLIGRLLGRTWIVEKLATAWQLAKSAPPQTQFVTLGGEMLTADGTLTVGPLQAASGLISRRSELRALAEQIAEFEKSHSTRSRPPWPSSESQIGRTGRRSGRSHRRHHQAADNAGRIAAATRRRTTATNANRSSACRRGHRRSRRRTRMAFHLHVAGRCPRRGDRSKRRSPQPKAAIGDDARRTAELEAGREIRNRETMAAKVELARGEQQLAHLQDQLRQFDEDRQERQRAIADGRQQLVQCLGRIQRIRNADPRRRESIGRTLSAQGGRRPRNRRP